MRKILIRGFFLMLLITGGGKSFALDTLISQNKVIAEDSIYLLIEESPALILPLHFNVKPAELEYHITEPRTNSDSEWIFWLLLGITTIIVLGRLRDEKESVLWYKAMMNGKIARQMFRDKEAQASLPAILQELSFLILFTLLTMEILREFMDISIEIDSWKNFLILCLFLASFYVFQVFARKVSAFIFDFGEATGFFMYTLSVSHRIAPFVLLPVAWFVFFGSQYVSKAFLFIGIAYLTMHFGYLLIRGLSIGRSHSTFDSFHFLLYICTLEIAPVLLLIKLLDGWVSLL